MHCRELFTNAILRGTAEGEPLEQFRRIIRLALAQIREEPVVFQVFLHFAAAERSNPKLGDEIRELWRSFRDGAADGIRESQHSGHYRTEIDPHSAAALIISGIMGLALQYLLDPGSFDLDAAGSALEDQFMASLAVPRQSWAAD